MVSKFSAKSIFVFVLFVKKIYVVLYEQARKESIRLCFIIVRVRCFCCFHLKTVSNIHFHDQREMEEKETGEIVDIKMV